MPSSVNPRLNRSEAFEFPADVNVNVMGGCPSWEHEHQLPMEGVTLKKRKREVEDQGKESTSVYNTRFTSPHIFQKQPSNRTTLRPRLRPVLLKRRRVDDDPRPFSIPWPIPHPNIVSSSNDPKSTSTNLHSFQKPPNPKSTTLNPCYICHRRPTTRSVLDAYADCSLCGNRACYICLRECLGPHCRTAATVSAGGEKRSKDERDLEDGESEGRKICSTCAVEGVTEYGEDIVWCLECVERDRGSMETS